MLEPGPSGGAPPPVPESGSLWVTVVSTLGAMFVAAVPYAWGRSAAKKEPAEPSKTDVPGPPQKTVVADLVRPVAVVEGSPEWLLVQMVNNLERRVNESEKRSEERDRDHQERYDALDRRWAKRYSELEKKHSDLQRDHYQALAEVKQLRDETEDLRSEVHVLRGRLMGGQTP